MKKLIALVLCLFTVFAMVACAQPAAPAAAPAAGGADQTYAIITKSAGNPYNEREASGFEEAIKAAGYTAIIKHPAEITAEAQITLINELVAQGVSGIAVAANDKDALETALKAAMAAGIKVVSLDSSVNPASRLTHINQAGVQQVAQALADAVLDLTKGEGDWAILSATSTASNQNAWIEAQKEIMKGDKYSKLNLVEVAYGDDEYQKSVDQTQALLQNYPNLKADAQMSSIMEELKSTENKVAFARQAYNDSVMAYNNKREVFPSSVFAGMFNFGPATLLEIPVDQQAQVRAAPKVQI